MKELYPPGTQVERFNPTTKLLVAGTVMDIPLCTALSESPSYQILFNNGMSASIPLPEMQSMIPAPPVPMTNPAESLPLLPPFLSINSWITYEHDGTYHKGFLSRKPCGMYCFSFKTHVKKKSKDWGVDLPNLPFDWVDLCTDGVLIPLHIPSFVLKCPQSLWCRPHLLCHLTRLPVLSA